MRERETEKQKERDRDRDRDRDREKDTVADRYDTGPVTYKQMWSERHRDGPGHRDSLYYNL